MTELDAINVMLRAIGSSPVNDIDTPHPDVANAKSTLRRKSREAQKSGWWFNIDYNVMYYPNFNNEIIFAVDVLSTVIDDALLVKRGRKLYDSCNNTYRFSEPVCIQKTIRALPWDEIPESMQEYIQYTSTADFVSDEIEDAQKEQSFQTKAGMTMLTVKKEDLAAGQFNSFKIARVVRARAGVRPYRINNQRFAGDPDR